MGNGLNANQTEEKTLDIYGPRGLRKFITTTLEISRSAIAYAFNIHELVPEEDQYPPDWNEWPVDHDCFRHKPMERKLVHITKTMDDKVRILFP